MSILTSIPAEIYTGMFSAITSGLLSLLAAKSKAATAHHRMLIERGQLQLKAREVAQQLSRFKDVRWTRRTIALICISAIVVMPMLAPIFGINVETGWTELKGGFWPFTDAKDTMVWHVVKGGIVITPFHTHTVSAIIGYYFGASVVENAR